MLTKEEIGRNLAKIEDRIEAACKRAGRDRSVVTLIAVSKMNPPEAVIAAHEYGIDTFGENKVQELCGKIDVIPYSLNWHLIGHLQTNKVKYIAGKVAMIHSVDSFKLAQVIDKESEKAGVVTDILLEINIAGEESKFGILPSETESLARQIAPLKHVRICGLMTVAPETDDPESNRSYFRQMRELSVDIASKNIDNIFMNVLSMGMTGDFEVAVEEGATHVRVGTGIFGARDYSR